MSYHVPDEVGHPVEQRLHTTDELHVFCLVDALLNEEDHEAGRDEGHGEDDTDGHQDIHRGGHPETDGTGETHDQNLTQIRTPPPL